MASTPLPPPPATAPLVTRPAPDARTQRRLDAARAARARRRHPLTAPTLRQRVASLRHCTRPYHTFIQVMSLSALAGAFLTLPLFATSRLAHQHHQSEQAAQECREAWFLYNTTSSYARFATNFDSCRR